MGPQPIEITQPFFGQTLSPNPSTPRGALHIRGPFCVPIDTFEDCCAKVWEDGTTLAGEYFKRRGWKESAINRAYVEVLRDAVMSLYEVSDVRSGESFRVRDLVRGREPVQVIDRTATNTLVA